MRRASCISLGMMVTRLAWMAQRLNLFSGHILLLDKSFQDFEPLSGTTVRNAVTTTSATMSFATLLLSFFILFWEDSDHHDRILAGVLDLQESMRVRESLLTLLTVIEVL